MITSDNFFMQTFAEFTPQKNEEIKLDKLGNPDFTSESGSKYWYTKKGVYRYSDHWGVVSYCIWENLSASNLGFCKWSDFKYIDWIRSQDIEYISYLKLLNKHRFIKNLRINDEKTASFEANVCAFNEYKIGEIVICEDLRFNCIDFHPNHYGDLKFFKISE